MPLMFLNGGAMRGGPLHHLLGGAPLVREAKTAARYRFYSVDDRFPALDEVESGGVRVAGELYDLPWSTLRDFLLPSEPTELELGVIELEDGAGSLAMIRRRVYTEPPTLLDISEYGDWREYFEYSVRSSPTA